MRRCLSLALLVLASGCSAVVGGDLDPLEVDLNGRRDVGMRLVNFDPHVDESVFVEFWRPDTGFLSAAAGMDPLLFPCVDIQLPFGADIGTTMVDFYADRDFNGLDAPPDDHVWREELDESGQLVFPHEFNFVDISADRPTAMGDDFIFDITGAEEFEGDSVVVSLIQEVDIAPGADEEDLRDSVNAVFLTDVLDGTVGRRRMSPAIEGPPRLRGVVDGGVTYTVELSIAPNTPRAMRCRLQVVSDRDLVVTEDLSAFECDTEEPLMTLVDCSR